MITRSKKNGKDSNNTPPDNDIDENSKDNSKGRIMLNNKYNKVVKDV